MPGRVYVSSTFDDLKEHRAAVCDVLTKKRYAPVAMESYVARDARVKDECLNDVTNCEIYVGIFARRYGHVPELDNPERLSITELEYRHAKALNKPRLLFCLDGAAPWPRANSPTRRPVRDGPALTSRACEMTSAEIGCLASSPPRRI